MAGGTGVGRVSLCTHYLARSPRRSCSRRFTCWTTLFYSVCPRILCPPQPKRTRSYQATRWKDRVGAGNVEGFAFWQRVAHLQVGAYRLWSVVRREFLLGSSAQVRDRKDGPTARTGLRQLHGQPASGLLNQNTE